ncbi:MAG: hypothetical protein HKO62_10810, partial [Gammaproteobacteria bacterium]|nr:hypothetical protein [Gammaproteobacteria bacterium]
PAAADAQERLSVFDSTGWALEDQVVMELLLERAAELGIGSRIQIEQSTSDPRDPYEFLSAAGAAEIARRVHGAGRR